MDLFRKVNKFLSFLRSSFPHEGSIVPGTVLLYLEPKRSLCFFTIRYSIKNKAFYISKHLETTLKITPLSKNQRNNLVNY